MGDRGTLGNGSQNIDENQLQCSTVLWGDHS